MRGKPPARTCTASRMHMHVPSTLVLIISTQLAVLPLNRLASLRLRPALFTCGWHRQAGVGGCQQLVHPTGSCCRESRSSPHVAAAGSIVCPATRVHKLQEL